jgi:myosin-5
VVHKPLSNSQAKVGRDTLSRLLYSKLFFMVVDCVNSALAPPSSQQKGWEANCLFVGLLDLFGFENFESGNHFEQLMVNYANEKMQHVFLSQVLQQELNEYSAEKISFHLSVPDNSGVVEMFEHRSRGIISILDDECKIEDATAHSFIGKLAKEWGNTNHLSVPKMQGITSLNLVGGVKE